MTVPRRIVHVVVTRRFAGVERYVSDVAAETAAKGWDTVVVGGDPARMRRALGDGPRWLPGGSVAEALVSLCRAGRVDVCHAHMTKAEAIALGARAVHGAPVVATRHFAAPRGQTRLGGLLAPWIGKRVARQLAVSEYVGRCMERPPDAILAPCVRARPVLWQSDSRVAVVLQRLEPEKRTRVALKAWRESGLSRTGWILRIVGDGSERELLQRYVADNGIEGVEFAGWSSEPEAELAGAGFLVAPRGDEPSGLSVLEAMAAGIPVVAAAAGGHLETIGLVADAPSFPPGDIQAAAAALRQMVGDDARAELSRKVREAALGRPTLEEHVGRLLEEYRTAGAAV